MAASTKTAEETAASITPETLGEIEKEKTFNKPELGGSFTYRLPHGLDHFKVLRRQAELMGVPAATAGGELQGYAMVLAMHGVYNVHAPQGFDFDEIEPHLWDTFFEMMSEVDTWHDTFRKRVGRKKV